MRHFKKVIGVKILRRDFEVEDNLLELEDWTKEQKVGPEKYCSNLMILFHWQIARINRKQQRAQNVVEKTNK